MKPNNVYEFIKVHWTELHRFALAEAKRKFYFRGRSGQLIYSQDPKDIVNNVMTKICTAPYKFNSDDLTIERFKGNVARLISTEISRIYQKEKRMDIRDPTALMNDEAFFDLVLLESQTDAERHESHQKIEEQMERVNQLLLHYEETDTEAFFVLEDWLSGKSMETTALDNGLPLNEVMNARKRIRRALR